MLELLVIKPSSFGDVIHGLHVVQSIKNQRDDVRVTWVATDLFVPILEAATAVDDVILYERATGFGGILEVMGKIRRRRFDVVMDMQGLFRSGLMTLAARAPEKIGRIDARECANLFYNSFVPLPNRDERAHAVDILLPFLDALDCHRKAGVPVAFNPVNITSYDPSLLEGKPLVFFPDSRREEKEWPYFAELAERIDKSESLPYSDRTIIWAGMKANRFPHAKSNRFHNVVGLTRIDELIPLIQNAGLVIANDSGAMHLAAAVQTPVLAVFGPTSPFKFGPYPLDAPTNHFIRGAGAVIEAVSIERVLEKMGEIDETLHAAERGSSEAVA